MLKYFFSLILSISLFSNLFAQSKSDTLMYYVTNSDDIVTNKESADYVLFIMPMKEENGKKLFPVIEYYPNGQRKLIATSRNNKFPLIMEGSYLRFFHNGKRQGSVIVENGQPIGDELSYYPNGKFYSLRKHEKGKVLLLECRDSTGIVLAENGNGEWLEFDGLFTSITQRGSVKDGLKEGVWTQFSETAVYKNGTAVQLGFRPVRSRAILSGEGKYLLRDSSSIYKSLIDTIQKFISTQVNRSIIAENNGLGKQMYVGFFVENNGSINTFDVFYSPSTKISDELIRVVKLSAPWVPANKTKKLGRTPVILPVFFTLDSVRSDTTTNKVFAKTEIQPEFPGGAWSFTKFLEKAIQYPALERESNVMGKVLATFIVEKDGSLTNIYALRTPSIGLAEEFLRVLRLSPKWKAGVQNGKPVRVQYTIPMNFSLGNEEDDAIQNSLPKEIRVGDATYINTPSGAAYTKLEVMPKYPGGLKEFTTFLEKNIRYPEIDKRFNTTGKVFISFIVENDGSITNIQSIRAPSQSLAEEGIRVIKLSPRWTPGSIKGRPVRVLCTVPINFSLDEPKATDSVGFIQSNTAYNNAPASTFVPVESPPEFPGGMTPFSKYLERNVRYPESDRKNKIQGKAHITFVVEKDGSLTDFKIVSAPSKSLGEEALRVMKGSPTWKAGIQNGKPVRVQYTVPINFTLGESF